MAIKGAINTSKLAEEINKALLTYTNEVVERVDTLAEFLAKEGVKKLKLKSPKSKGKDGGAYAKSWKDSKINGKWIIHNVKHYRLTHLLEKGHAKIGGGRVQAYPHIAPVEKELVEEYIKGVEEAIRK